MNIKIRFEGTSPLLMHNPRMVDPDFALNREIKVLTAKRKKTDEDLQAIERLEWHGGLYHEGDTIIQPTSKMRKCLINTAKMSRLGKAVERTVHFKALHVPLEYAGPNTVEALFADKQFHSRLSVGVGGKRIMRVRPQFNKWALECDAAFVDDAGLQWDELLRLVELAGTVEGIGDNRVNGYGRFKGSVIEVK